MLPISLTAVRHAYRLPRGIETETFVDLNLDIPAGQFVAIVGPSGCGKSTLLRLMAGLLQPTAGTIQLNGSQPQVQLEARQIAFVFQDPALLPWRSTLGNVSLPLEIARTASPEAAYQALVSVGLAPFASAYPHQLSGGMRSRAALARALVLEPSVLLLDEPFGALDELTADDMAIEVVGAWTRHNFTAVMVTHNLSHAVLLADRVVVLSARPGRIVGDIPICLPRPRSSDTYEMSAYHQSIASIRRLLGSRASADEALRKRQIVSPT